MGMNPPAPERRHIADYRKLAPTAGDMFDQNWDIIADCTTCGLKLRVDLVTIIKLKGRQTVLWCAKTRCKKLGCPGKMQFLGKPPERSWHDVREAPWPGERR